MIKRFSEKENLGITLIALVITIIVLLILAGITVAQLSGNGLLERTRIAKNTYKDSELKQENSINEYNSKIDEIVGNRSSTSRKDIIFNTSQSGTREINIEQNVNNWDFIIVYYMVAANTSGSIVFDTTETSTYHPTYCNSYEYCLGSVDLNVETNKITMTVTGSSSTWNQTTYSYLTKAIGVKL